MAIYIDEMKELQLYNRQFFVPIQKENKHKGSCVFLLTPNYNTSKLLMINPNMINLNMFRSYYMERDVALIISPDGKIEESAVINEEKLSSKERTDFGLPEKKKYPMPDKEHVLAAIRMFNYVDKSDEATLAKNINKRIQQFGMEDEINVGSANRFSKYFTKPVKEFTYAPNFINDDRVVQTENYIQTKDLYIPLNEVNSKYNSTLKKILYNERIKTNKEMLLRYDRLKEEIPIIDRTYLSLDMYKGYNLFMDYSYYSELFFKNNKFKKDKALALYFEFLDRFIRDPRFISNEYTRKTVFIPVFGWDIEEGTPVHDHTKNLNPMSMIVRFIKQGTGVLYNNWNGTDFLFIGKTGFFKVRFENLAKNNLTKFINNISKLYKEEAVVDIDANKDSAESITAKIINNIEQKTNLKIDSLNTLKNKDNETNTEQNALKALTGDSTDAKKAALVSIIKKAAENNTDVDKTMDDINNDEIVKSLIVDLTMNEDDSPNFSATRIKRINTLHDEFLKKKIDGKTVKDLINNTSVNEEIPKTNLPIDSIDDEWDGLTFMNFEKAYDAKEDILNILNSLSDKSIPVAVRNVDISDISTSEDNLYLYSVDLEDAYGKRFNIKLEIPKLKNNRYMRLRGNDKIVSGQLLLLPIIKTDEDTVQVVSNYNKIFIRRYGTNTGKSFVTADKVNKALKKCLDDNKSKLKIVMNDNTRICSKYELPIDYIDLAGVYGTIETPQYIFYFNQDIIREKYKSKIDLSRGLPIAYDKKTNSILYNTDDFIFSVTLASILCSDETFKDYFENASESVKYTYSKASILNTEIPLVVVMAYSEGLQSAMKKSNIKYEITDKRNKELANSGYDVIRFKDGYLYYELNYNSSLLMNGLKECNTEDYSVKDINNKPMWLDFLDNYGGRINADGLDNFYDLMIDPITAQTCKDYNLPDDYISILAYANYLLIDNKYNRHVDITGNRLRTNEIIAGYAYKVIAKAYGDYQRQLKRNKNNATMSCKRSAVVDGIMLDPTESDASVINPILDAEAASSVSFKGLSGMNSDRSYGLDKRTFDKSMLNTLALSTGFASNVGLTRSATIDANISGKRGYIKQNGKNSKLSTTKTLSVTEALTPFGTTSDDPFRTAMTFIQTSKHGMRIKRGMPMLVSNGADEALPYLTTDTFAFKAKKPGIIHELKDDYLIIKYNDNTYDFVDLRALTKKNSDGGFFVTVKLDANVRKGQKVKANQIVAYDKLSYSNSVGDPNTIAFNNGVMAKIAILVTDEGFEDSAIIDDDLSEMMSSDVVVKKDVSLNKNTNVYKMLEVGTKIQEGDPLIIFQNSYDEADANALLKTLAGDANEINELGRIVLRSKVTGVVSDIKMYRTVELNELSPSLRKIFKAYEDNIKKYKSIMDKYHIDDKEFDANYKLDSTGKLKGIEDGVLIEYYLSYHDKMSVGDKLVYYSALKGVVRSIFPKGEEPYTDRRPKEKIRSFLTATSVNKRMVGSIIKVGSIQKVLVELDRSVKDIYNIKWDDNL